MYNVSADYIAKVRGTVREDRLTGSITFLDETTQSLTDADFGEGTVSIARSAVTDDKLTFGEVISAELTAGIRTNKSRYAFFGATISLLYGVKTGDNTWEDVPLGVFNVINAERVGKLVKITAYDNLQKLDKLYGNTVIFGTVAEVMEETCSQCGLVLNTPVSEIDTWPNALTIIQIDKTNGCNSYREALRIACQLVGAFAQADRDGGIVVRQFGATSIATLTEHHRYKLTVADYECVYAELRATGMAGEFIATVDPPITGLSMVMDDAPAWDYGLTEDLQLRANNLLEYLGTISYTPCDVNMPGDPAFDCGDRVTFSIGNEDVESIITNILWKYRASMTMSSVGENPYLSGVNTIVTRSLRMLTRGVEDNKLVLYNFTNSTDVMINDSLVEICSINFATTSETQVLFFASIILHATAPQRSFNVSTNATFIDENNNELPVTGSVNIPGNVNLTVTYKLDENIIAYYPLEQYETGAHTIVLFFPIEEVPAQSAHTWKVFLTAANGTFLLKEHDAKITLWGQNLVAEERWDGNLLIEQDFEPISINPLGVSVIPMTDSFTLVTQTPIPATASDNITPITIAFVTPTLRSIYESISVYKVVYAYTIDTSVAEFMQYDEDYVKLDNSQFAMQTNYTFLGSEAQIDDGRLMEIAVDTQQFARVDSLEILP